jgi:gamma-glutamyltranspeptidase / glutathione hydrolase
MPVSGGVVAAGHPATAEAGVWALRGGGNAVDAAVAAVGASIVAESPLTGLGAGGFMLVHRPGEPPVLLDFFVAAPGIGEARRRSELEPVEIDFGDATQVFNIGPASCGVPGVPSGLATAAERFGSMPLADLLVPGARLAREGVVLNLQQAYLHGILFPILGRGEAGRAIYASGGRILGEGERVVFPELAETLERLGTEGPGPFYTGDLATALSGAVIEGGGSISREDLAGYETIAREPVRADFRGREILTNPPPSSGGVLIALALELLERAGDCGVETLVRVMEEVQSARTHGFLEGLYEGSSDASSPTGSARRPTSPRSTKTAAAPASRARTAAARASSSPGAVCRSTTCSASRTSIRSASTRPRPGGGCPR